MSKQTTTLRPELEALPYHMSRLPIDDRGYPVPWFVAWVDGKPEFRAADTEKWRSAVKHRRCWVCGDILGANLAFVLGPMCAITRTTAEPPCHTNCARWSARNCPFLNASMTRRREDDVINNESLQETASGRAIARCPGVALVWMTHHYSLFRDPDGKPLITVGEPDSTEWYAHGRCATRDEVLASINSGIGTLEELASLEPGGIEQLWKMRSAMERFLPEAADHELPA